MGNPKACRGAGALVRPSVRQLHAYVPGEQPKIKGLIKLNTNENPYPPSPKVLAAIKGAVDGRLRLYPNATAQPLREKLARFHRCRPENIIVGNGSDELLALATRAFVEPASSVAKMDSTMPATSSATGKSGARPPASPASKSTVQFFKPSYSLYPVLAAIHGARTNAVSLTDDFGLPAIDLLQRSRAWDFRAALSLITTPNAPSGRGYRTAELEALCRAQEGVVVLDEAYVDFAETNALDLALKLPNVLIGRTFSKAYALCFLRVGYFVGHPELIAALDKIRDSYNVNGLGQAAALATLRDLGYYRGNFRKIVATRERLIAGLTRLGFSVRPSQTNFILARPPAFAAEAWLGRLRQQKILVRWFSYPEVRDYLRITIGTDAQVDALVRAVKTILSATVRRRTGR